MSEEKFYTKEQIIKELSEKFAEAGLEPDENHPLCQELVNGFKRIDEEFAESQATDEKKINEANESVKELLSETYKKLDDLNAEKLDDVRVEKKDQDA